MPKYEVFSGLYFPTFGLNTETYFVSFRIQSYLPVFSANAEKYGPEKILYLDTFQAVQGYIMSLNKLTV